MIFLWRLWRIKPRFTRAMLVFLLDLFGQTGSHPFCGGSGTWIDESRKGGLGLSEHALDALHFALKERGFFFESSLLTAALVKELVAIVRPSPGDLPRPGYLEPLRRGFEGF